MRPKRCWSIARAATARPNRHACEVVNDKTSKLSTQTQSTKHCKWLLGEPERAPLNRAHVRAPHCRPTSTFVDGPEITSIGPERANFFLFFLFYLSVGRTFDLQRFSGCLTKIRLRNWRMRVSIWPIETSFVLEVQAVVCVHHSLISAHAPKF